MPYLTNSTIGATRTCPHPDHVGPRELPFTSENFYVRPSGSADYWCRECVRRYNRAARGARQERRARRVGHTRKFGVEMEVVGADYNAILREARARGIDIEYAGYTHRVTPGRWKIVTDGSLPTGGLEVVSPPLSGDAGMAKLEKVCEALRAAGARVSRACGMHVHHDVTDLDVAAFGRLARGWSVNQRHSDRLVAPSRRGSTWARALSDHEVCHIEALPNLTPHTVRVHFSDYRVDRYRALNVACYPRQGTVELRQHQGSINFKKIAAWVAYGQAFIAAAKAGAIEAASDLAGLLDRFAADGHLAADTATFLKSRADHFSGSVVGA